MADCSVVVRRLGTQPNCGAPGGLVSRVHSESDSSGFVSGSASNSTLDGSTDSISDASAPQPLPGHRRSSGQRLAKLISAFTPCRGRTARRSHSLGGPMRSGEMSHVRTSQTHDTDSVPRDRRASDSPEQSRLPPSIDVLGNYRYSVELRGQFPQLIHSAKLDMPTVEPSAEVLEFRRKWPASFATLVINYLGFLSFSPEDSAQITDALVKEAKSTPITTELNMASAPITKRGFTPQKMIHSRETRGCDKDLEHWYIVTSTIISYLLEEKRYNHRFILRRPGNHSCVNELECALFPSKRCPLSMSVKNHASDTLDDGFHQLPAAASEVVGILNRYDSLVIACLLSRVLRRRGIGLIPPHLRRHFLSLVNGVNPTEPIQRRAIRLLFQLVHRRLIISVLRPLLDLLAHVANEPECEVDQCSLAVLFAPVFFMDRATTTPASLANPLPSHVVELFVSFARRDLQQHQSVSSLFQIPVLFQEDCARNLRLLTEHDDPPLSCSLRYCVTMTQSPRCRSVTPDTIVGSIPTDQDSKSVFPKVNLTSTFMGKRPRQRSPLVASPGLTPLLKSALLSPTLDFRVRRTPTNGGPKMLIPFP
ncbi:unnamed protein product [Dicrocoelium dendriticum]|nr:unnamed protein product [Dicrocoelium dendriticum]